jgi:Zn2+/Cd2+-exporting ATPase
MGRSYRRLERLRKARLDVHFLMLAVAGGAALIGAWREGALLLFLFSASGAMEHYAMGRTWREISVLFRGARKRSASCGVVPRNKSRWHRSNPG